MPQLLDFIFGKKDLSHLSREEVIEHLQYLEEIITPELALPDQIRYLAYQVRLNRRLLKLNQASQAENRSPAAD